MTYQKQTPSAVVDENDDSIVVDVPYQPTTTGLPVETFTLQSLVQRRGRTELTTPQRIQFELFVWCTDPVARHEVDFDEVELAPDRILHVRPGQVHRWVFKPAYEAGLILLQPLARRRNWKPGPQVIAADGELRQDLIHILGLANREGRSTPLSLSSLAAIRDLLVARLHVDDSVREQPTPHVSIHNDFERLLAEAGPPIRTVEECARRIGCSARTLTRACQSVASVTPKRLIDQAVALEAQRLLSVGGTATQVADTLGFVELAHFSRFFARVTNETPSSFVASLALADKSIQMSPTRAADPGDRTDVGREE